MIQESTLFILGAGASRPYGYPTGSELRQEICSCFVKDSSAYFEKQGATGARLRNALDRAEEFTNRFYNSSTKSIDLFLARNPEFMVVGKWAIIFRILAAERNSTFREQMANRNHDWYSYLFEKLTDDLVKKEEYRRFCENKLSFITFNYDRSLEHFLYESLLNSFHGIGSKRIVEQLSKLRIIHVFGQVAGLEWQDLESKFPYGTDVNRLDVQRLADKLRIIYEENDNPEPELEETRRLISDAQRIFFLGFGYAKENLELLNIPHILRIGQRIHGTALGSTEKESSDIRSLLAISRDGQILQSDAKIHNWDCVQLLRQYL